MDKRIIAESHSGVAIALFALTFIGSGVPKIIIGFFSGLFLVSSLLLFANQEKLKWMTEKLALVNVEYLPIFLGLISLCVVLLGENYGLGIALFVVAYIYLIARIWAGRKIKARVKKN